MTNNILICDDDRDIVSALKIYLESENYRTFAAYNGRDALAILEREEIHLVLLDVMMPVLDGVSTLSKLRESSNVPVILLTAKSEDTDKILGLNVGADDYVTKPFNPVELLARVRSQLRRYLQLGGGTVREDMLTIGSVSLDDGSKNVTVDGEPVNLTPREYDILKLLMQNPGKVFHPRDLYRKVWNEEPFGAESTVENNDVICRFKIDGIAPLPYFRVDNDLQIDAATTIPFFHFPLVIPPGGLVFGVRQPAQLVNVYNAGSLTTGFTIVFKAVGTCANPKITNARTLEYFEIDKSLVAGEKIVIDTLVGEKSVIGTLLGVSSNYYRYKTLDSVWLQLQPGDNVFRFDAAENPQNIEAYIQFANQFLEVQELD